ncbi:porin [Leptothrix ochracea]|uniref:porin n=1 Tax=Leptothrix ochracea TaxID=735331 RepID=UPI0034E23930
MKTTAIRTLIATAALASIAALPAVAQAQTSIKFNGLFDLGVSSMKAPGAASATSSIDSGNMSTSWIGFSGSEELGNGLTAILAAEQFIRNDTAQAGRFTGDGLFTRNAYLGLKSATLGTATIGRNTTPLFVSTLVFNAFGDSFGVSPAIRHYFLGPVTGDSGWNDSVQYSSPNIGGLSVNLINAQAEGSNGINWGGNAMYFSGALALSYAMQDVKKDGNPAVPTDDTHTWQVGGSFDLKSVKFYGQIGDVKNNTTGTDNKISGLGAKIALGTNAAILAQWGILESTPLNGTTTSRRTLSIGYDRNLGKHTDVYAAWMRDTLDQASSDGGGVALGIRHAF